MELWSLWCVGGMMLLDAHVAQLTRPKEQMQFPQNTSLRNSNKIQTIPWAYVEISKWMVSYNDISNCN